MGLMELFLASLSDAPGAGVGSGAAAAGTAAAAAAESPQMCQNPSPEPEDDRPPPMSWDWVTDPPDDARANDVEPAAEPTADPTDNYYTTQALRQYGDWLRQGSTAVRAAKAATGVVVLPVAAYAACGEDTLRWYGIGKKP